MNLTFVCFSFAVVFVTFAHGSSENVGPQVSKSRMRRFSWDKAVKKTSFWLYTRMNPENGQQLRDGIPETVADSYFNSDWPTRIVIHGFASKRNSTFNRAIKGAYLQKGDFNVIVVDWSKLAGSKSTVALYPIVASSIQHIGRLVGSFTQFLHINFNVPYNDMYLIGHSLGAHISGYAANYIKPEKFNTIFALDPAGPTFDPNEQEMSIDANDAVYVESIQSNLGHWKSFGNLGQSINIGQAAFYPNYGDTQPGCSTTAPMCSHSRAYKIFAESINNDVIAKKCSDMREIYDKDCTSGEAPVFIGGEPSRKDRSGIFYLKTNSMKPFTTNAYLKASDFVKFSLHTKTASREFTLGETVDTLREANFNPGWPTRVIICDADSKSPLALPSCQAIREAYFNIGDYNIFYVEWQSAVFMGVYRRDVFADDIGVLAAELTLTLQNNFNVPLDSMYLIGAGAGARVAHYAAKRIHPEKYDTIYVLDYDKTVPLIGTKYIEAIQTSSITRHEGATFFPNYQNTQKKCKRYECTHEQAYQYFKDSLTGSAFNGNECLGIRRSEQNLCVRRLGVKILKMGGDPSTHKELGTYYRATRLD